MDTFLKALFIDAGTGFYRVERFKLGDFFGPVDLGLHLSGKYNSLNIGTGLLCGSIIPGSNRLIFSGFSPCWGGFYVSSMGGAGLVFDNLGINMISIINSAHSPSIIYLNRSHGEEIEVKIVPVDADKIWKQGRGGVYSMMEYACKTFGGNYENDPRVLATGPAARATDIGAICSAPIVKGRITPVDTWAGRGGFGAKLLKEHGIAAIIYGGTFIDEDFRNRSVADEWFMNKYNKKLAAKDFDATVKYRFDPKFGTGGTFGSNYAALAGSMLSFNYTSIYLEEEERLFIHKNFILNHYLKQFNSETISAKQHHTCGEPCAAVCKKMNNEYKKDYEPYQAMGPLCGIFDQRAAEKLAGRADACGFDAISIGGVLAWLMECLSKNLITPAELGVSRMPVFSYKGFNVETDSNTNAELGCELIDSILEKRGIMDFGEGARKFARRLAREKGPDVLNCFVYNAFARKGWMAPNQYWTPGVLSPMAIAGKYYMYYGQEFIAPRELGRVNASRFRMELMLDNLGLCRFHRGWAEDMAPEIIETLFGIKKQFMENILATAERINSRNSSVFWETRRNCDLVKSFLQRKQKTEGSKSEELAEWAKRFEEDCGKAALDFWYEMHKGTHESLRQE
ncbi:MAG: aldehyde ferredoxin oxidoreductase [Planctomycetes bacterium]|nr:aldehyde ferredoxin oxidoreductase [Planctomycetota bacterium]